MKEKSYIKEENPPGGRKTKTGKRKVCRTENKADRNKSVQDVEKKRRKDKIEKGRKKLKEERD